MTKKLFIGDISYGFINTSELTEVFDKYNIRVDSYVTIGNNVRLNENIIIERGVYIGENVTIGSNVRIEHEAIIKDDVIIGNNVYIKTCATIKENCKISNNITIGEENTILKDTILDKSIHIEGSKNTVTYTGNNRICIGCLNYDIDYWKSNILSIGQKYEYSDSEIKEYEGYVNKVEEFLNSNK